MNADKMGSKLINRMCESNSSLIHKFGAYIGNIASYKPLLFLLIAKEFKGRFKYTYLGYLWHIINPLIQITIYYLMFTVLFGRDIPNYWIYVSSGMFAFGFINSCISGSTGLLITNKNMITKIAFPKEILFFAKVINALISLSISYCILIALMVITSNPPQLTILLLPVMVILLSIFCIGIAFIVSSLTVYLRDVQNLVSIIMGYMLFAIPIFYVVASRSSNFMNIIWGINPLFYFIESIHNVLYYGIIPSTSYLVVCIVSPIVAIILGLIIFKNLERGFTERL